jgi:hypothetical protein
MGSLWNVIGRFAMYISNDSLSVLCRGRGLNLGRAM